MSVSIKTFSDEESAKLVKFILGLIEGNRTAPFTCTAHMKIRHAVNFKKWFIRYGHPSKSDEGKWSYTPEGLAIQEWIDGNISGKYSIQISYVYFEDYDDALLCYLRFKD